MADKYISKVYLLNTPLEKDYKHTIYFLNGTDQKTYFQSRIVDGLTFDDFSYVRKDGYIRLPAHYDELIRANYLMYQNSAYSNKWYYCFIKDIKYIDDGRSDVYIETDVMQTYMFDYDLKASFIEREHVKDDTIGLHTIPENVETGDYVCNDLHKDPNLEISPYIIMGSTAEPSDGGVSIGQKYGGIYSGANYFKLPYKQDEYDIGEDGSYGITYALQNLTNKGKGDAVTSVFLAPKFLIEDTGTYFVKPSNVPKSYTYSVEKKYGLEGYTPKNNKLKTYPYCFLLASNGNGGTAEYRYEYFASTTCDFVTYGVLTPGCSIRMMPTIYRGVQLPEIEGLNLGKFPQCNWATEQYTNWLTQNGINVGSSYATGSVSALAGAAGGTIAGIKLAGPVGGVVGGAIGALGGLTQILNTIQQTQNAERVPPQTQGNVNCGDVVAGMGNNTFIYYNMSIKKEYAEVIDKYFDMFGYKINLVKKPNMKHRSNYWYLKTIDVNIDTNVSTGGTVICKVPESDLEIIKNCYNNGITFWRYNSSIASTFKNYEVENGIIG